MAPELLGQLDYGCFPFFL